MNRQRQFEIASAKANQEVRVIGIMLADLDRTIGLLNSDIAAEEERTKSTFSIPSIQCWREIWWPDVTT